MCSSATRSLFLIQVAAIVAAGMFVGAAKAELESQQKQIERISINPPDVQLVGRGAAWQILVDGLTSSGRTVDATAHAKFTSLTPKIATVSDDGLIRSVNDGMGSIEIKVADQRLELDVNVTDSDRWLSLTFEHDVISIFNRFGCNGSGCHGKAEGQNGFKLSVFGFDPNADYQAIAMEARGRRVFAAAPERSLLLQKVSGIVPHGGGVRIETDREEYKVLQAWIESGMPRSSEDDPVIERIELFPKKRQMTFGTEQRLRAVVTFADGRVADVSRLAQFQSNNDALAVVDESGLVRAGQSPGSVAIMVTYMGNVDVFHATIPRPGKTVDLSGVTEKNTIDHFVHQKLKQLNISPSSSATDHDFLRRVYLDIIGTLPTAREAKAFLADTRADKRARLVDELLDRPEFADYWALKWADLLRINRRELGRKQAYQYYRWIHDNFRNNRPLDKFAAELLTAEGPLRDAPAGHFYKVVKQPNEMASTLSQALLGVRIECAQCHHHPFDRWSQTDYFGMQAFFTQVGFKNSTRGEMLQASGSRKTVHPRTGQVVFAHALDAKQPEVEPEGNRRLMLAMWLTAPDNPWFARNLANRAWAHFMGRGLVEPVDDVRLTNPPSNPELLNALAQHLIDYKFDFQELIRFITASQAYQRSNQVNETNEHDEQNYSRFTFKPLDSEVLFDAVCQVTGAAEKFHGVPVGPRAIQLWDSEVPHDFLKLFGRPTRATACECERVSEPNVSQVLHAFNSPRIQQKLSYADGLIAKLVRQSSSNKVLVEELYLTYFARYPSDDESKTAVTYLAQQSDRRQAAEDIAWSMLNSLEFLFNH